MLKIKKEISQFTNGIMLRMCDTKMDVLFLKNLKRNMENSNKKTFLPIKVFLEKTLVNLK
ncbi:hypothetical protein ACNSOL_11675 (plasmid) [Aliarcobacter lanthieri]|uniref:hypothetical protein n=1 Tax=Aliarcobacter lanthieri TaxID=1355374 RepID=UPI003AAD27BF